MRDRQLPLFDDDAPPEAAPRRAAPVEPAAVTERVRSIGLVLPPAIRLGTSSWSFPGWTGLVFAPRDGRPEGESRLAREGLAAYARHPLLRTVSLDRTFYAPLTAEEFAHYSAQVPEGFRFVVKAPAAFTDPVIRRAGSGEPARDNATFLDAAAAVAAFVRPAVEGLGAKAGPLVFQFPPLGHRLLANVPRLVARLAAFAAAIRGAVPEAIVALEPRDPALAGPALAATLADSGAVPCLAVHARMPGAAEQAAAFGLDGPARRGPLVARWNLHAGRRYEEARADYFPFDRLVEPDEPTRAALARLAVLRAAHGDDVFITINNKAEGSAPLSVVALAKRIVTQR